MKRGEEVPRPTGWVLRCTERKAAVGWDNLVHQAPQAMDRAWVQITGEPRQVSERQHQLRGKLSTHHFKGHDLEVWQYEVTSAGRVWYLIDDDSRTLWVFHAGPGHPKSTE